MNVIVLLPLSAAQRARLEAAVPGARFTYAAGSAGGSSLSADASAIADAELAAADAVIGNLAPSRLAVTANLKLLQLNSAGYDAYTAPGTLPAGAVLACARGAYGQAVSEHALAMLLALMKHLPGYRDEQRDHAWTDLGPVTTPAGARVLVLGTGDIGSHFARLMTALGAHVHGVRRHADGPVPEGFEAVHPMDDLASQLVQADVVASFLPSAPATRRLADAAFFAACKPGAYFVNAGRGDLVDQPALIDALRSCHLAGAALDVTAPEPLPADDPLWDAPNLLITPHISGGFHLPAVLDNIVGIAADNLRRLATGEPLRNVVNGPSC